MDTKPLLFGLGGFLLGGLLVSIVAATSQKPSAVITDHDSMNAMVTALEHTDGDNFDKEFISGMIAHHRAAIDMAKLSESRARHQEVKDLSKTIITAQQQEINDMKQWQVEWGYSDLNTPSHMAH